MTGGLPVGLMIKQISSLIEKEANNEMKSDGMTLAQANILDFLFERNGGKTTQKDVENYLNVSHPTVVGILRRMEAKGLIKSGFDEADRRMKSIYLTDKAGRIHKKMMSARGNLEERMLRGIDENDRTELRRLLGAVYENVK